MEVPESIQIKIISTPKIIEEMKKDWAVQPQQTKVLSSGPDEDLTSYQWGLEEAATLIAVIQGAIYFGELAHKLYNYLKTKDGDEEAKKIVVQTPLGRWEFVSREDLTEAEIKEILTKLAGATA